MSDEVKEKEVKPQEDWMTKKWRPMMAMMYMMCCLCDFAIFPIMFTIVQFWETAIQNDAFRQWVPITLQGGGLFHVAMGAVLGVSAYGRTQEKVAGAANINTGVPTPTLTTNPAPMVNNQQPAGYGYTQQPSYSQPNYTSTTTTVVTGYGGKAAPPPAPQPLL